MKVERVCASVRYSKALGDGQHKTIELTAEGSVEARETWQTAQAYLYNELGKQMKELWPTANRSSQKRPGNGLDQTDLPDHGTLRETR